MELPENVVPMPAEQREELKRLAQAATVGPWRPVVMPHAKPGEAFAVVSDEAGHAVCTSWNSYDACFQAAVSPGVALATLAYVEALEAEVQRLTDSTVSNEVYTARTDAYVASIDELRARLSTLEAAVPAADWFPPTVFDSPAEYDASVADVCRRIESGEITPRQVELNSLHRCPLCDESPCGMCPEHAKRWAAALPTTGEGKEVVSL